MNKVLSEEVKKQIEDRIISSALQLSAVNLSSSPWIKKPVQDLLREFAVNFTLSVINNQDDVRQIASQLISDLWKHEISSRDFILLCDRFTPQLGAVLTQAYETDNQSEQLRRTLVQLNHQGLMLRLGVVHANMEIINRPRPSQAATNLI
ncbi:MAG: hypothetical protein WCS37_21100 [Chloroflexota bacterium]|nr:hypothetical protein [Chloroflexota bacterium]